MSIRTTLTALLLSTLSSVSFAQNTPEQAAALYISTIAESGMSGIVELTHPDEIEKFHSWFKDVLTLPGADEDIDAIFGQYSAEELRAMSAAEFMRAIFSSLDPRMRELTASFRGDVLGTVMEGDTAHVVTRIQMSAEGVGLTKLEVLSLRRHGDSWLTLLSGDITGMANAIQARMAAAKKNRE